MSLNAVHWAFKQTVVKGSAKSVLIALAVRFNDVQKYCYPGIERVSEDCGLSRTTVIRGIKKLDTAGLVNVERRPGVGCGNKTNVYRFPLYLPDDAKYQIDTLPPEAEYQADTGQSPNRVGLELQNDTQKKVKKDIKKGEGRASRPLSLEEYSIPSDIEYFALAELGYDAECLAREIEKWRDNRGNKHAKDRSAADWVIDLKGWLKRGVDFGYHQNSRNSHEDRTWDTVESFARKLGLTRSAGESEKAFKARVRDTDTLRRFPQLDIDANEQANRVQFLPRIR